MSLRVPLDTPGRRLVAVAAALSCLVAAGAVVAYLVLPRERSTAAATPVSTGLAATQLPSAPPSATATPTPAPSASPSSTTRRAGCAAKPSDCGYPDATNTGVPAGTRLTRHDGDLTIRAAGTVVDGKDIRGCVRVEAAGVTIRRSKITCTGYWAIGNDQRTASGNLLVEDVEIDCGNHNTTAVGEFGFVARRLHIHGCENGFDVNTDVAIEHSYIHSLYEGADGHADGIQLAIGQRVAVTHNSIFVRGTSAMISHPTTSAQVRVADNFLAGGAATLYCPRDGSRDFRVVGNRFGRQLYPKGGYYFPWTDCAKVAEVRGNYWDDTLASLNP